MLTFDEFKSKMCIVCGACPNYKLAKLPSSFCYEAYKKNSTLFTAHSFQKLRSVVIWPISIYKEDLLFTDMFCKSGLCGNLKKQECKNFDKCSTLFSDQKRTYTFEHLQKFKGLPFKVKLDEPAMIYGGSKQWIKMVKSME